MGKRLVETVGGKKSSGFSKDVHSKISNCSFFTYTIALDDGALMGFSCGDRSAAAVFSKGLSVNHR